MNENEVITTTTDFSKKKKSFWTMFFDKFDNIDRFLYGKRLKFFVWGALLVLIIAPLLDELFGVSKDKITFYSTLLFFLFIIVLFISWISTWRDDEGNFTRKRFMFQIKLYFQTSSDFVKENKGKTMNEYLYSFSILLIIGSICWKALQNVSVLVRNPIESLFGGRFEILRSFESITRHYYWIVLIIGILVLVYLYYSDKNILKKIKKDLLGLLFNWRKNSKVGMIKTENIGFVINAKDEQHVNAIIKNNQSDLFKELITSLQNWNPKNCYYEYEFQYKLRDHLKKSLEEADIELEKPIGTREEFNRGRADIVIDDTILIELKRDPSAIAIQRAKGQIGQYAEIWKNKGPVILLLCNYNYEHAKISFTQVMTDLNKLDKNAITIVAKPIN
jgi:hypothetical protein